MFQSANLAVSPQGVAALVGCSGPLSPSMAARLATASTLTPASTLAPTAPAAGTGGCPPPSDGLGVSGMVIRNAAIHHVGGSTRGRGRSSPTATRRGATSPTRSAPTGTATANGGRWGRYRWVLVGGERLVMVVLFRLLPLLLRGGWSRPGGWGRRSLFLVWERFNWHVSWLDGLYYLGGKSVHVNTRRYVATCTGKRREIARRNWRQADTGSRKL